MNKEGRRINDRLDFDALFNAYYPRLFLYAIKLIQNRENAEEIVQDVFVKFWMSSADKNISFSIKAYLFRAVLNACIDFRQKEMRLRKKMQSSLIISDINEFEDPCIFEELNREIESAIDLLPEKCKKIFLLSREQGLTHKEISEKLNISIKTVENQITRAIKKIRPSISKYLTTIFFI